MSYPGQGQPPYPPAGAYPQPQGQPGYPPAGQAGYPPPAQPGYPPSGAPVGAYPPAVGGYPQPQAAPAGAYPPAQGAPAGSAPSAGGDGAQVDMQKLATAPDESEVYTPGDATGLKQFEGYGEVGFGQGEFLPPPPPPSYDEIEPPQMEFGTAASITAEEARDALLQFVSEHCCYGAGAAKNMMINNVTPSNALHYTLETFCEGRTTARVEVPFFGGTVDGPYNGRPPMPWDFRVTPTQLFADEVQKAAVPHTEEVRMCGMCIGCGWLRCRHCMGMGRDRCGPCNGTGHRTVFRDGQHHHEHCGFCHGCGRRACTWCNGSGRIRCKHCKGAGQVKNYIELTINFKNHKTDFILEETDMPDELVRGVQGVVIFEQSQPQVWPISTFPVRTINENSTRLVENAKRAHPLERQIKQRQILRAVPVTEIDYKFKDQRSKFWVYGLERKVHCPDYPQKCCCGCNIL